MHAEDLVDTDQPRQRTGNAHDDDGEALGVDTCIDRGVRVEAQRSHVVAERRVPDQYPDADAAQKREHEG